MEISYGQCLFYFKELLMDMTRCTDGEFDAIYPIKMRKVSHTHWTPVAVARKAAEFLIDNSETKLLDLGSGAGKFCLIAAACSKGKIFGIEQRENMVRLSAKLAATLQLNNVIFILKDIRSLDFTAFDAFYFFNSFEENINPTDKLDRDHPLDAELFGENIRFLNEQFGNARVGTKIVTYCGEGKEIPDSFTLLKSSNKGKLKFWVKRD